MLESQHYKHHATFTWFKTKNQNPHISKTPEQQLNASRISKDVLHREILFSEDKGNDLKATHKMNTPFQHCTVVQKAFFSFLALLQWCFTHLKLIPRELVSKQTQTSFRSWTTAQLKAHLQLTPESPRQPRSNLVLTPSLSTSAVIKMVKLANFSINCFRFH